MSCHKQFCILHDIWRTRYLRSSLWLFETSLLSRSARMSWRPKVRQRKYQTNVTGPENIFTCLHLLVSILETAYCILTHHLSPNHKWDLRWLPLTRLSVSSSLTQQTWLWLLKKSIQRTIVCSSESWYRHHRPCKDLALQHRQEEKQRGSECPPQLLTSWHTRTALPSKGRLFTKHEHRPHTL